MSKNVVGEWGGEWGEGEEDKGARAREEKRGRGREENKRERRSGREKK